MSIIRADPLAEYTNLQIRRETEFSRKFSSKSIFSKSQQEDILKFRFSIQFFLITNRIVKCYLKPKK